MRRFLLCWFCAVYADTASHRFHTGVLGGSTTEHRSHDCKKNLTSASLPNQIWETLTSMLSNDKQQTSQPACRSYLAPSSLPGAGLGMFAGKDFVQGEHVTTGDAVVPLLDVDWNNYYKNKKNFLWGMYERQKMNGISHGKRHR